ncbi:putative RNA-directed DNA polymerase from transposon BS [Stylophora pistillata]|uniref:Putative RNA-directed DNA polymerase from transposon BS n=1 Tax=Stylophora pistillata TaxID=50429 RepID=A0A2B4RJ60_STYPI|nr:putative RNA-directed DNA polymerase from transposon BS [Stylophora pistillata]
MILLCGDIHPQPGPSARDSVVRSPITTEESEGGHSTRRFARDTSGDLNDTIDNTQLESVPGNLKRPELLSYFDLGLGDRRLRFGHWNVNRLISAKFEQIKFFHLGKSGVPQVDVLFLKETFLKANIPDSLYTVPGFTLYRCDRLPRRGSGVLAFVSHDLRVKRRTDLENTVLEIIWLEVIPFKSNRSHFISGIYRPPSHLLADDIRLEANIEQAYLLNKEMILLGDFNIDALNRSKYNQHRLSKGLKTMNFDQLVNVPTRPISETCLDHIFSNQPQRIQNIICPVIGLADHLPLFARIGFSSTLEDCESLSIIYRRRQLVSMDDKESPTAWVRHGVLLGSIISPLLFIAFINDLPLHVSSAEIDLYADDTTLISAAHFENIDNLQSSLTTAISDVIQWATANKLPLNENKTKVLTITGKRLSTRIEHDLEVLINGKQLENVQFAKLLGLEIDQELTFIPHIDKLCKKLSQRRGILKKIKYCLPLNHRLLFYNAMIRPVMDYVNVVWSSCDKHCLNRVLKLQKRAARIILDADS